MSTKEEKIESLALEYPKHFYFKVKKKFPEEFEFIENQYSGDKFSEKAYKHIYGKDKSVCNLSDCDSKCAFRSFTDGYRSFCSKTCSAEAQSRRNRKTLECIQCGEDFTVKKSKDRKLCSRECWSRWNKRGDVQEKAKKQRRETCEKLYGDPEYSNVEQTMETKKERYGDPTYNNIEKVKDTMKERYGGMGASSDLIQERMKETFQEKYGVDNPFELESIQKEISQKNRRKGYNTICSDKGRFANIEPLFDFEEYKGRYVSSSVEYSFKCLECGEKFDDIVRSPSHPRCPNCYPVDQSKSEKDLQEFVSSLLSCEVKTNYYGLLNGTRELDIYIPEKNVAIEFNGIYWHSEDGGGECGRSYHLNKTEECESQGIQLIHVFENEWVEKKDIVKSRLKHILGQYDGRRVYARDTKVREVDPSTKNEFLNQNHLQGEDRSNIKLGLFLGDELVSLMTFSRRRIALGGNPEDDSWEMSRFCSSVSVVGGASKLFKNFIRKYDPEEVVTYADRRWSSPVNGIFYEKIGFDFVDRVRPSYHYFHQSDRLNLKHRFNFRKNKLSEKLDDYDPNLTEWENMKNHGYNRIWDCGKLKYKWSK